MNKQLTAFLIGIILIAELRDGYFRDFKTSWHGFRPSIYARRLALFATAVVALMFSDYGLCGLLQGFEDTWPALFGRHWGRNVWIWLIGFYYASWLLRQNRWRHLIFGGMLASALTGIVTTGFKFIFLRARPTSNVGPFSFFNWDGLLKDDSSYQSFSSGDVGIVSGAAFFFAAHIPNRLLRIPVIMVPALTAFARITYNRHWPSDALASIFVGVLFAQILFDFKKRQKAVAAEKAHA